jgi:hypothetical protein
LNDIQSYLNLNHCSGAIWAILSSIKRLQMLQPQHLFQVMTLEAEVAMLRSQIEELQMKLAESEKELVSRRSY